MKTAMQELIHFTLSEDYNLLSKTLKEQWYDYYLNKEKEQLSTAFYEGYINDNLAIEKTISEYSVDYVKNKYK